MAETLYVPKSSAKVVSFKTSNGDEASILRMNFKVEDFVSFLETHVNDRGYITIDVKARKEVGEYGDTHSLVLNTYKKEEKTDDTKAKKEPEKEKKKSLPF